MRISYFVSFEKRAQQIFSIRMEIEEIADQQIQISLPNWTPGSYKIRDYSGKIRSIVFTGFDGEPVKAWKVDKSSWKMTKNDSPGVKVSYEVYANELTPRTNHLDSTHALINPSGLLFYVEGYKEQTSELTLIVPENWKISTGLEKISDNKFRSTNYDIMADSPIEVGTHAVFQFKVDGKEHEVAIFGTLPVDSRKFVGDIEKIVTAASTLMKGIPPKKYCFIIDLTDSKAGGGLEHMNSTVIVLDRLMFLDPVKYIHALAVVAHEYFHLWNVKRVRPIELGPFNYKIENYTHMLWFAEGITDYYAMKLLLRAGLIEKQDLLKELAKFIGSYSERPGRKKQSLYEASYDTWIKFYQPTPDAINSTQSYYLGGMVTGLGLDIKVCDLSNGQKSLDDLMRLLFEKYRKDGKGYTDKELLSGLKEVFGQDMSGFFDSYIKGNEEIPLGELLGDIGLDLKIKEPEDGFSGLILKKDNTGYKVASIVEGSSAWNADLTADDEIVAVNGIKFCDKFVNSESRWQEGVTDSLAKHFPERVKLAYFRRSELMTTEFTPKVYGKTMEILQKEGIEESKLKKLEKLLNG